MIEKVVHILDRREQSQDEENLKFWLSKTPRERVAAVEYLRRQYYGDTARLQRVARVVDRPRG